MLSRQLKHRGHAAWIGFGSPACQSAPAPAHAPASFPLALLNDAEDVQAMRSYLEGLCAQLAAVPDDRLIGEYASMKAALLSAAGFLSVSLHPLGLLVCSLPFVLSLSASLAPQAP